MPDFSEKSKIFQENLKEHSLKILDLIRFKPTLKL